MASLTIPRALSAGLLVLGCLTYSESLDWRGTRFGGFFLTPNLVVPSVGLADWSGARDGRPVYQHALTAVDGVPVSSSAEAYARTRAHQVGDSVAYTFSYEGHVEERRLPLAPFDARSHFLIFGTYLLNGAMYLLLAALAAERWRDGGPFPGLAAFGWVGAAFAFTAMDLYGPGRLFRLHVLAESMLAGAAAHLTIGCLRLSASRRAGALKLAYGLPLSLAVAYELLLNEPAAYSAIHDVAQALGIVPVIALVAVLALGEHRLAPELTTTGARHVLAGAFVGVVIPAALLAVSGAAGGRVPVNAVAWVAFVFPLTCIAAFPQLLPSRVRPTLARAIG
jgi:hypothetical protein